MRGARAGISGCGADNGTVGTMGAGSFPADGATCGRFSASSSVWGRFATLSRRGFSSSQRTVGLRVWSPGSRRVRSAMNFRRAMMSTRDAVAVQAPSISFSGNSWTQLALYRGFLVSPVTRRA